MPVVPLEIAAGGGTVLTANKRLARQLVRQFDERQMAAGVLAWPSPAIFSLDAWLMRLAGRLHLDSRLLTEAQGQRLWEEVVAADALAAGCDLLQVPQAARRASEAQRLLSTYLTELLPTPGDEEQQAFRRWREAWLERLRRRGWLDRGDLLPMITAAIAGGQGDLPAHLVVAGFDDLTPAVRKLFTVLEDRGCRIEQWAPAAPAAVSIVRHDAIDMVDEVRRCARWARLRLEQGESLRIGVVVPQLTDYQGLIERLFRAEFDPAGCLAEADSRELFTLSLGTPLAREGVVRAALRLLGAGDPLHVDDIGWLLRSPYLGGSRIEGAARARADRELRRRGRSEWQLTALSRALIDVPRMQRVVAALLAASRDRRRRLPGEWAEGFAALLDSCGWPGDRGVSSREYQAIEHFRSALGELATLDRVASPMARGEALALLNRLAAETVFQAEGGEGRIQVLGMLEAAGFTFDALWVLGLHERAFPAPARPHPFLPLEVQSRMRMPHADAAREREFAQQLAYRLFAAAPEIVVSWPGQLDGAPLRPSPLISKLPTGDLTLAPSCDPFQALLATSCALERFVDERATPLATGKPFTGGTGILTDQALCPFRAFAHHRLRATQLDTPDLGLDNLARGNLVHGVLERFWRQIQSQSALLELDDASQEALLELAAAESLAHYERRSRCDLPPRLRALELRRLKLAAAGWLELERTRAPFRVVAIEQRHDAEVGQLRLRTRIDRIDELTDGQLAVIDYKTGRPDPRQWLDPRVTEPQLPLYCLGLDAARIEAVLFAVVRNREKDCMFRGVARQPAAWPRLSAKNQEALLAERGLSGFDEILAHWRVALPALGDAFVAGLAAVDPVDPRQACQYCDLMALCRIHEQGRLAGEAGEGEDDE